MFNQEKLIRRDPSSMASDDYSMWHIIRLHHADMQISAPSARELNTKN
jgi:hypothetical protein